MTAPFGPHLTLIWAPFTIQPHVAPFKTHAALFKWQSVVREKQGRYQNDQHNELSHMGPRSALYNCPVWAPFNPHLAPFTVQPCMALFKSHLAPFTIQPYVALFKPCMALFKWQPVVIDKAATHQNDQEDELSHMGSRSAPYNCPIWAPFDPHLAPFTIQPHVAPFKTHAALFKWQPVVREKQGRYQNDQHDELSHMGPRSAPYDCPIQAPFNPHLAPFTVQPHVAPFKSCSVPFTIQPHAGVPFRGDDFQVQHHKIHQNVQLNQQRKLQQSRPSEYS